ncbi:MAG: response regulator transcription factor [Chloroflexi bacterium]|nr:response regulator transcription factor [Chloroflexota bacterium]
MAIDGADTRSVRVLVADDQTVVREGLVMLLGLSPGIEVVGAAADGEEAVQLAQRHTPDVVLMDLRMPRTDGVAATRRILETLPNARVIVLTTYADDESVFAALEAGARGYLTKDATASEIQRAIRTVHAGEALLDPSVQRRLIERALSATSAPETAAPALAAYPDGLTQREAEVLREIAAGRSNREIAERLVISEATVKTHVNNIFSKANLRDRAQAVVYALHHGLAQS